MIGLYPSIDVYTRQLRALEAYATQNPQSAPAHLVLAYQYVTQGHTEAAVKEFERVVSLQPTDMLSKNLLSQLQRVEEPSATGATVANEATSPAPHPVAHPAASPSAPAGNLTGTWTASPDPATTINLSIADGNHFDWKVNRKNGPQEFQGDQTYANGVLTLVPAGHDNEPPMTGRVTWKDDSHFTFKLLGSGPADPGLSFTRAS
jgi:hypothetical protein